MKSPAPQDCDNSTPICIMPFRVMGRLGLDSVGISRTTGAPQNHWFGPAGDPRGAGIGTREAIRMVWSCHREVIYDQNPVADDWERPTQS